jgi:hypothetical protein
MRKIGLTVAAAAVALAGGAYVANGAWSKAKAAKIGAAKASATKVVAGAVTPVPLPDGPNFPVPAATINRWIAQSDTAAIRGHAWSLWQGMSAASGQYFNGQPLPIWETWAGPSDVFPKRHASAAAAGPPAATLAARLAQPRVIRDFAAPLQFHHNDGAPLGAQGTFGNSDIMASNKFNPQAATFIDAPQPGPGGGTYSYTTREGLQKLNASWPATTPPQNRGINDFPIRAIETKPVFGTVKAEGLTIQPLWQGPSASTDPANPYVTTWTTCVLIDPTGAGPIRPATPPEIHSIKSPGPCKTFLWAPLSTFYAVKLSAPEARNFQAASGKIVNAGDFAVLLAMHVNTKEIPFWTWQTFWWQPGPDTPNGFPGSKQGQPAGLRAPWTNYAACAAYSQTTTPTSSTMQVCFNPYLETSPFIPAGLTSNCMSCHGVALYGPVGNYPKDYKRPITFFSDPTYFNTSSTNTDFSWAVAGAPS